MAHFYENALLNVGADLRAATRLDLGVAARSAAPTFVLLYFHAAEGAFLCTRDV
jgi:hypothetical protein